MHEIDLRRPTLHKALWRKSLLPTDKFTRPLSPNSSIANQIISIQTGTTILVANIRRQTKMFFSNAGLRLNPCNSVKHLQARKHFKHKMRHTKKINLQHCETSQTPEEPFLTKLPSSIKAPSWKTKHSYILTFSQTRILREDSKTVISNNKFVADHNKLLTS